MWAEANRIVATGFFAPGAWQARLSSAPNYASFDYAYQRDWLRGMCQLVGVRCPPDEQAVALARRAEAWIVPQVKASIPGASEAVQLLHRQGYTLYTASGSSSKWLQSQFVPMGIVSCFKRLYGPDLIDTFKAGPEFYRRVLADTRIAPSDALVVDDSPEAVRWATEVGARAVLIDPQSAQGRGTIGQTAPSGALALSSLAELPALLRA
jgi:HAD superfamily hydrolase (TIGR01509 family)